MCIKYLLYMKMGPNEGVQVWGSKEGVQGHNGSARDVPLGHMSPF